MEVFTTRPNTEEGMVSEKWSRQALPGDMRMQEAEK